MFLRIECPGCKAVLQIEEALAGRQGKCIHCGHKIVVPGKAPAAAPAPPPVPFLTEASPEAMVRELRERKKSALLLLFEPTAEGSYDLTDVPDAKLKCIATEDITQPRFAQLVASLGKRFAGKRQTALPAAQTAKPAQAAGSQPPVEPLGGSVPAPNEPYDLKGDQLGMSLEDFKQRYARFTDDGRQDLPICSNQPGYIGKAELHSEAWHQRARIVHARIDHPLEDNSPTVAGVKTDLLLYKFMDGRLFCIESYFATDMFHFVSEALVQKYGPAMRENKQPRELVWENEVSLIGLTRGTVHPRTASTLHLIHKQLLADAEARKPQGAADV